MPSLPTNRFDYYYIYQIVMEDHRRTDQPRYDGDTWPTIASPTDHLPGWRTTINGSRGGMKLPLGARFARSTCASGPKRSRRHDDLAKLPANRVDNRLVLIERHMNIGQCILDKIAFESGGSDVPGGLPLLGAP